MLAAERLAAATGDFRLQDLVMEVQRIDPARGRGTIQPTVQGMTVNAGTGPPSPYRKPLLRSGHGLYPLADGRVRQVTRNGCPSKRGSLRPSGSACSRATPQAGPPTPRARTETRGSGRHSACCTCLDDQRRAGARERFRRAGVLGPS
jgi:hypothetical protein